MVWTPVVLGAVGLVTVWLVAVWMYRTGYKDGYNDYREGERKHFLGEKWKRRSEHPW